MGLREGAVVGSKGGSSHSDELRVHIVPHSHDDSGWLKTFLQYYWGDKQGIQAAGVQYILDSVVDALLQDDRRRFSYAEMSFFMTWWKQQDEGKKEVVRELVRQKRLDFVNGGFVQHDEAASHYVAMIDQTTRGHRFLKEEFGFIPRVGWQIDPFGHSTTQAGLLGSVLGFDALFFGRADWEDMEVRKKSKSLEFVWQGSGGSPKDCRDDDGLFVGNFASGNYGPPRGFNFELSISDTPIQDDPSMRGYNVPEKVSEFIRRCEDLSAVTRGSDIMFTMGSDFHYSSAASWFKNLDKLMDAVNEYSRKNANSTNRRISVFYSTPLDYVKAKASYDTPWPVKIDDFFPYSDAEEAFWTGYFTSRPTSKRYIRQATSFLQAARHLETFVDLNGVRNRHLDGALSENVGGTDLLEEAVSLCQHHDSITGTEKQAVADDYHLWIYEGLLQAEKVVARAFESLMLGSHVERGHAVPSFEFCHLLNISICDTTVNISSDDTEGGIMVSVYNPTSFARDIPIFVPISLSKAESWQVIGPDGNTIPSDVVPFSKNTKRIQKYHYGGEDFAAEADVVFSASVEGLGYSVFEIQPVWDVDYNPPHSNEKFSIANEYLTVNFDAQSGRVRSIVQDGTTIPFSCDLFWYNSSDGLNSDINKGQSSGAYIFRPNGKIPVLPTDRPVRLDIVHGDVVSEARLLYNSWGSLVLRLYGGKKYLEVEWTIGPLPDDGLGREVVVVYGTSSEIQSSGNLWTDANGRSMVRRIRNKRPSWDSDFANLEAGNYYPMTSAAYVKDDDMVFSLITDRSQGVASFNDGEMEVMLHRRTVVDDSRGVGEPLNEEQCVGTRCVGLLSLGKHLIQFSTPEFAMVERRLLQQEMNDDHIVSFSRSPTPEMNKKLVRSHSFLPKGAQMNFPLHILTINILRREKEENVVLLRIAHQMDAPEGAVQEFIGASSLVDLVKNFGCDLADTQEVSLSTNQKIEDVDRLHFTPGDPVGMVTCSTFFGQVPANNITRQSGAEGQISGQPIGSGNNIRLDPMQRQNRLDSLAEGAACFNQGETLGKEEIALHLIESLFLKANGPQEIPEPVVIRQNNDYNIFPLIQQMFREEFRISMDKFWGLVKKVYSSGDVSKEIWRPRFQGSQLKCLGTVRYPQTESEWDRLEGVMAGVGLALMPRATPAECVRQIRSFVDVFGNLWKSERRYKYKRNREIDVDPATVGVVEERRVDNEFQSRPQRVQRRDTVNHPQHHMTVQQEHLEEIQSQSEVQTSQTEQTLDKMIALLTVGGKEFTTTMATLHCVQGSFFSKLIKHSDGASEFFVDRSPLMFDFILDYLRAARYNEALEELPLPDSIHELQSLMRESIFYRLPVLTFLVEEKIEKKRVPKIEIVVLQTPAVPSEEDLHNELSVLSKKANSLMQAKMTPHSSSAERLEIVSQDIRIIEHGSSMQARLSLTVQTS